jgi:hypothetical protein
MVIVRIHDRTAPASVGQDLDAIRTQPEQPALGVVTGGRQDGVTDQLELPRIGVVGHGRVLVSSRKVPSSGAVVIVRDRPAHARGPVHAG